MTHPTAPSESSPELKVRIHEPLNVEAAFLNPPTAVTANEQFFRGLGSRRGSGGAKVQ